jgi:hypothetical protein
VLHVTLALSPTDAIMTPGANDALPDAPKLALIVLATHPTGAQTCWGSHTPHVML